MSRKISAAAVGFPKMGEYLVINLTTGGRPSVAHSTLFDAQQEAVRLAGLNVGQMFTVVQVNESKMSSTRVYKYC